MKKLQIPYRNKKVLLLVGAILALLLGVGVYLVTRDNLSDSERQAIQDTNKVLEAGAVESTVSQASLQEIQASISADKKQDAKKQLDELLKNEDSMNEGERLSAYTALAQICVPLEDFACIDRVIAFQRKGKLLDYFFAVDAARLAKKKGDLQKSKDYYGFVKDDIELRGGDEYIENLNNDAQLPLDYNEVKEGAK